MKLGVAVNHCAPYHVGGSEKVVDQIVQSMKNDFGMDCHIFARYISRDEEIDGIKIHQAHGSHKGLIDQINSYNLDHLLVYSDSFAGWPYILQDAEHINCKKSIALVGMNYMRNHGEMGKIFSNKHKYFNVIAHSDNYNDYKTCKNIGIPVKVIPNGIDLNEMKDQGINFREKYGIDTDKIILCVSNFFPGKGQEHLYHILQKLSDRGHDFTAVYISSTTNFQPAETLRKRNKRMLSKSRFKNKALHNIPRSDVIQAFQESNVFAFPSQVEVAPLVILEAMASSLPWVSLNVGNISQLDGGLVIDGSKKVKGRWHYSTKTFNDFTDCLESLLLSQSMRYNFGLQGRNMIEQYYNWDKIKYKYKEIFDE